MTIIKITLLTFVLTVLACSQTVVYKGLEWEYDYADNDPANIQFHIFRIISETDTNWVLVDSTQSLVYGFDFADDITFSNREWYFFVRANRFTDNAISLNSNVAGGFFPVLIGNQPYNFKMLRMKLP